MGFKTRERGIGGRRPWFGEAVGGKLTLEIVLISTSANNRTKNGGVLPPFRKSQQALPKTIRPSHVPKALHLRPDGFSTETDQSYLTTGRKRCRDLRYHVLDAILYVLKTGIQLWLLPENLLLGRSCIATFGSGKRKDESGAFWPLLLAQSSVDVVDRVRDRASFGPSTLDLAQLRDNLIRGVRSLFHGRPGWIGVTNIRTGSVFG